MFRHCHSSYKVTFFTLLVSVSYRQSFTISENICTYMIFAFIYLRGCFCSSLKFKEISFAYDVLSNPEKKEIYDRFGMKGLKEGACSKYFAC